jgi:hypothetical protein
MFKRKQRPTVSTTPPNFLDLRQPAKGLNSTSHTRTFNDISTPFVRNKSVLAHRLPAHVGAVIVVGLVLTVVLALSHDWRRNPFSSSVLSEFKTQSYYPTYLPKGYALQTASVTVTGGALTFILSNGDTTQTLFFSEQVMPKGTDLQSFYQTQIPDAITATTPYGGAVIGHYANVSPLEKEHLGSNRVRNAHTTTIASLATPETWILITAPSDFSVAQLKQVVLGLRN